MERRRDGYGGTGASWHCDRTARRATLVAVSSCAPNELGDERHPPSSIFYLRFQHSSFSAPPTTPSRVLRAASASLAAAPCLDRRSRLDPAPHAFREKRRR